MPEAHPAHVGSRTTLGGLATLGTLAQLRASIGVCAVCKASRWVLEHTQRKQCGEDSGLPSGDFGFGEFVGGKGMSSSMGRRIKGQRGLLQGVAAGGRHMPE